MSILFIADIHLNKQQPEVIIGFVNFLRTRALFADALYILGDLFDIWIGDDDPNPLYRNIAIEISVLHNKGIPCYFIHGNRDFLLGNKYASICNMKLLPEHHILQYGKQRIIIMHGDTLCTQNNNYQYFRRLVHSYWLQRLFLFLPVHYRLWIANKLRINSVSFNKHKTDDTIGINYQSVNAIMNSTGATVMIHGHTHNPAIYLLENGNFRAVLGSWHKQGSVIEIKHNTMTLFNFPFYKK